MITEAQEKELKEVFNVVISNWASIIKNVPAFTNGSKIGESGFNDDLVDVDAAINQAISAAGLTDDYTITFEHTAIAGEYPTLGGCADFADDVTRKLVNGTLMISRSENASVSKEFGVDAAKYGTTIRYYTVENMKNLVGDIADTSVSVTWDEYKVTDGIDAVKAAIQSYVEDTVEAKLGNENYEEFIKLFDISTELKWGTSGDPVGDNSKPETNPQVYKVTAVYTNEAVAEGNNDREASSEEFKVTATVTDTPAEKQLDNFTASQVVAVDSLVYGAHVIKDGENTEVINAIKNAIEGSLEDDGIDAEVTVEKDSVNNNYGYVDEDGTWSGKITLKINGGDITNVITKDTTIRLEVSDADVVTEIELTDTRTPEEKLIARKNSDPAQTINDAVETLGNKVTFKVHRGDKSVENVGLIVDNNTIKFVTVDKKGNPVKGTDGKYKEVKGLVLDYNEFEKKTVGSIQFYVRSSVDADINTGFEGKIYYDNTLNNQDDLFFAAGVTAKKAETGDSEVATASVKDGEVVVRALKEGTTSLTVTAADGNLITVDITVKASGAVTVTTQFESESVEQTFKDLGIKGATKDSKIVSGDEDYLKVEYCQDRDGNDSIRFTPQALANKEPVTVKVYGGDKGKIVNTLKVSISETGALNITKSDLAGVEEVSVSISDSVKEAIQKVTYYRDMLLVDQQTAKKLDEKAAEMGTDYEDYGTWKNLLAYTNDYLGLEKVADKKLTITVGDVTDTLSLSDAEFECTGGDIGNKASWKVTVPSLYDDTKSDTVSNIVMRARILVNADSTFPLGIMPETAVVADSSENVSVEKINKVVNVWEVGQDILGADSRGRLAAADYYAVMPEDMGDATIEFSDENGQLALLKVSIRDNKVFKKVSLEGFALDPKQYSDMVFEEPDTLTYYIGDDFSIAGSSFKFRHAQSNNWISVNVRPEMFTTVEGTVFNTDEAGTYKVVFNYGGLEFPRNADGAEPMKVTVQPRVASYSLEDLNIPDGEKLAEAKITDGNISDLEATIHSDEDFKVKVTAKQTDVDGVLTLVTDKGNVKKYNIHVTEDGQIEIEDVSVFKSTEASFTVESLGLKPSTVNTVVSSDEEVATAVIENDTVIVTSIAPGETTVTVTDTDNHVATIEVTVNKYGDMDYTVYPYTVEGWVGETGGDWYYIKADGTKATSEWLEITEGANAGWYHFGADSKMQRGWIVDESGWKIYYLDGNGRMLKNMWINASAQESLGMPAGLYHLQSDGTVQMNGWAQSVNDENIYWYCNAGNGLFEKTNPASWAAEKLW